MKQLALTIFSFLMLLAVVQGQSCENAVSVSTLPFTATGSIGIDSPLVEATGAGTCFPLIFEGITRGDWYELEGTGECLRVVAFGLLATAIAIYKDEGADCSGLSCQSRAGGIIVVSELVTEVNENYKVLITGLGYGNYQVYFEVS